MSSISENIKRVCQRRRLTVGELADKLSVPEATVESWESGEAQPDIEMLVKIADVLDTDITVLVRGLPQKRDRIRAVRRLVIACGIALVLGIAAYILTPIAAVISGRYYDITTNYFVHSFLTPAFWLVFGWAIMQGFGVSGLACPVRSKVNRMMHFCLLAAVLLYVAVMLPFFIESVPRLIQIIQHMQNPLLQFNGPQYISKIPIFIQNIDWKILNAVYKNGAVFVIPGIIYWLTGAVKRKSGGRQK